MPKVLISDELSPAAIEIFKSRGVEVDFQPKLGPDAAKLKELADDILSETFIRLWHARERVDLTTVKAYLLAIARNLFLADRRHARRMTALDERTEDTRPSPERCAQTHDELAAVLAALRTLTEIDRAAVLLRAEEGMSYDEVAAALGISPVAARVKVHRARVKLAGALRTARVGIAEPEVKS